MPFSGPRLVREAPGGFDLLCRQRQVSLGSKRPLYQTVPGAEVTLMGELRLRLKLEFNVQPKQFRVDGLVCQLPKKHHKRLQEWGKE